MSEVFLSAAFLSIMIMRRDILKGMNYMSADASDGAQPMLFISYHRVIVDDETIYEGDNWREAANIFLRNAQRLDISYIIHRIEKQYVPLYDEPVS
jgi:hypothetical protein